jgi:predicted nucleic acid-binding Zn ribbon protein
MRKQNQLTLGEAINLMVTELKLKTKLDEARIKERWAEVMGKPIAKYTSSVSFKKGKLYIKVESAPLKQELSYSREKIKELFNTELGETVIQEVILF